MENRMSTSIKEVITEIVARPPLPTKWCDIGGRHCALIPEDCPYRMNCWAKHDEIE